MISAEDIPGDTVNLDQLVEDIADVIVSRENDKKPYGIIVVSEGIADKLPDEMKPKARTSTATSGSARRRYRAIIADAVKERYRRKPAST